MSNELNQSPNSSSDEELIEKFLDKSLAKDELLKFNQKIKTNPLFVKQVKENIEMIAALKAKKKFENINTEIEEELKNNLDKLDSKRGFAVLKLLKPLASIAAILLILFLGFLFIKNNSIDLDSPDKIVEDFFDWKQFNESPNVRSSSSNTKEFLLTYSKGDYEEGLRLFEKVNNDTIKAQLRIYAGIMYLENEEIEKAKKEFQFILNAPDILQNIETPYFAKWYIALALISENKIEESLVYLEDLASNNPEVIKRGEIPKLISRLKAISKKD